MDKIKAVFVGTGMIGAGLAANAMLNGYETVLYDVVPQEKMRENISHILDILVDAGAATRAQADQALADCQYAVTSPLAIVSGNAAALEAALRAYQGRALYSGPLSDEVLLPLAEKYGLIL